MADGDIYSPRGTSKLLWIPSGTVLNGTLAALTQADLNGAVDLGDDWSGDMTGFEPQVNLTTSPRLNTTVDYQSKSSVSFGQSSIDLYRLEGATTVFDLFDEGNEGDLVIAHEGIKVGTSTQAWGLEVANRTDRPLVFGQDQKYRVSFAIKSGPTAGTAVA